MRSQTALNSGPNGFSVRHVLCHSFVLEFQTEPLPIFLCVSSGICRAQSASTPSPDYRVSVEVQRESLANARDHFKSKILRQGPPTAEWPDLQTPKGATEVVYPSGQLKLKAWISIPSDTGKHEAVLFLHPGFALWPDEWDFTKPLRDAGYIVMMPTTRGENGQHGVFTMYYDEVSDVISAAEYLRFRPEVDPKHLYIAGYSVGGTLTLLASEMAICRQALPAQLEYLP